MPKKMVTSSKAKATRAQKSTIETEKKEREARKKEDQYRKEAEGARSHAAKKREEDVKKCAEAATLKAKIRRLADIEQQELKKASKKPNKKGSHVSITVPKVTKEELLRFCEEERLQILQRVDATKKQQSRTADKEEYERMVLVANTNKDDSVIEAHFVEDVLSSMAIADALPVDKHLERRLKASF